MSFSHRDHRTRRELRQLYVGFGAGVGLLAALAAWVPYGTVQVAAVLGLASAGAVYLVAVDRVTEAYQRDLAAVRSGAPISGSIRAEVYDEVGFERGRGDDWSRSPLYRRPEVAPEPPNPGATGPGLATTPSARSSPPSDGS